MAVLADFDTKSWRTLSTNLRLKNSSMNTIEKNNKDDVVMCLRLALIDWLKLTYNYEKHGKPSWKKLAKAMKTLDGKIFESIVSEYPAAGNNYSKLYLIE